MKYSKKVQTCVGIAVWVIVICMVTPLNTMISQKSTSKRIQMPKLTQADRHKNKLIWIKTSDNVRMELPEWHIDQMKAVQHKGAGTQYHWVDAPMITSDELVLVQKALNLTYNLEAFRKFYAGLTEDQKDQLINTASKLQMQGLTSLLMTYKLPDVQGKVGATIEQPAGIIAPVVAYLQNPEKIPLSHKGTVRSVAFSPDGNRIISAATGIDHNVILYDLKNGKEIKNLVAESFPQPCVAYSPDGKYIATGSTREFDSLILWDGVTGEKIKVLGEGKLVNCVAFSADSNYILAGSRFGYDGYKPILYDVKTGKIVSTYKEGSNKLGDSSFENYSLLMNMEFVAYRPNSNDMLVGGEERGFTYLYRYDCKTFKRIQSFNILLKGNNPSVAYSVDGEYLVGGGLELFLWNAETGEKIHKFNNFQKGRITCIAFHPSGDYIAVCYSGSRNNVMIFDCRIGDPIGNFEGLSEAQCVAFSPDGYSFLYGGAPGLMLLKLINKEELDYIATKLNLAQARLLYRLYVAKINYTSVILDTKDLDYQIYLTLPAGVQKTVKAFLPFELASDITEKAVQEKMNELRSLLLYNSSYFFGKSEKKHDEKIKAVKDAMQKFEKNSVAYKACEKLLIELELEEAFK